MAFRYIVLLAALALSTAVAILLPVPFRWGADSAQPLASDLKSGAEADPESGAWARPVAAGGFGDEKELTVHLYFANPAGRYLSAEPRVLENPRDPTRLGRTLVEALFAGPTGQLVSTLPESVALRTFFVAPNGIAYVDLTRAATADHPGGCQAELLSVYSIVNTLVLNSSAIRSVKILVEGNEIETLAGHIDLHAALSADMLLIR